MATENDSRAAEMPSMSLALSALETFAPHWSFTFLIPPKTRPSYFSCLTSAEAASELRRPSRRPSEKDSPRPNFMLGTLVRSAPSLGGWDPMHDKSGWPFVSTRGLVHRIPWLRMRGPLFLTPPDNSHAFIHTSAWTSGNYKESSTMAPLSTGDVVKSYSLNPRIQVCSLGL